MIPTFEDVMSLTGQISNENMLHPAECKAMYETLCEIPNGGIVVEVGCDLGRSSSLILQMASAKWLLPIHVDPWNPEDDGGTQATKAKRWMEVMCERCKHHPFILFRMTTAQANPFIAAITTEGIDFAYIDGCHDTPIVEKDLQIVASRVKPGGFLAVHDYPSGGVTEAVDPFVAHGWRKYKQAPLGLGIWRRD